MKHQIIALLGACVTLGCAQVIQAQDAGSPARHPDAAKFTRADYFKKLDVDGNGSLSKEEFTARSAKAPHPDRAKALLEERFTKLDTNKDGVISLDEFLAGEPRVGTRREGHASNKAVPH